MQGGGGGGASQLSHWALQLVPCGHSSTHCPSTTRQASMGRSGWQTVQSSSQRRLSGHRSIQMPSSVRQAGVGRVGMHRSQVLLQVKPASQSSTHRLPSRRQGRSGDASTMAPSPRTSSSPDPSPPSRTGPTSVSSGLPARSSQAIPAVNHRQPMTKRRLNWSSLDRGDDPVSPRD